jgi:hypothetical protein
MEQVKIFAGLPSICYEEINSWLAKNADSVDIVRVLQSSATSGTGGGMSAELHISIFYRKM